MDKEEERRLEQEATELLEKDAKENETTLYQEGIINDRRRRLIAQREKPMSTLKIEDA